MIPAHTLLAAIRTALATRVTAEKGQLDLASTPDHLIELLATTPAQWRLILIWPGFSSHPEAAHSITTDRLTSVIQSAKGLHISPAADLVTARPNSTKPHLEIIELISAWFRSLRFPTDWGVDPNGFTLESSDWLSIDGLETRQHQLNFNLVRALPPSTEIINIPA